jgi:hypothetical protein
MATTLGGAYNPFTQPMVIGHGVTGDPSGTTTYEDLVSAATRLTGDGGRFDWPHVAKTQASWLIPSTLPSRKASQQVDGGYYVAIVGDIDGAANGGRVDFADVEAALLQATGGCVALIYSTKSATFGNPRWRFVVPLERPLAGADYADTASALFELIRKASGGHVDPDDAAAKVAQIAFLPNRPEKSVDEPFVVAQEIGMDRNLALDLRADHPVVKLRSARRAQREEEAASAAESQRGQSRRLPNASLIGRFNSKHKLADLLRKHGYEQMTDFSGKWPMDHWRSRYQTSGSYATRVYRNDDGSEKWVSLSGSDAKRGLGAKSANGGARYGDAFDIYVHFEHGGDIGAALEAWKAQCDAHRHVEVGQYMARRRTAITADHDRLRARGGAPTVAKENNTSDILKALRRLGRSKGKGTKT